MAYNLKNFMAKLVAKNPSEIEFHQAVHEVTESVIPFIEENPIGNYSGKFSCQIKVQQPYVDEEALAIKKAMGS